NAAHASSRRLEETRPRCLVPSRRAGKNDTYERERHDSKTKPHSGSTTSMRSFQVHQLDSPWAHMKFGAGKDVGSRCRRMPKREPWQVAGNAAEVYERELVPAVFGPWGPRVVELAALRRGLRVLDVACGTGLVARLAAEAVGVDGRVAALDLNPGMLAVASELPAVEGAAIEWVEGDAQALPFGEASFDVVCCQLGLQFFPHRERALRE